MAHSLEAVRMSGMPMRRINFRLFAALFLSMQPAARLRSEALGTGIDYAVLQFPASVVVEPCSDSVTVYGQVYIAGVTDVLETPAPGVLADVGWGAPGTDPSTSSWRWLAAVPNAGFDFTANNDEYAGVLRMHSSGSLDFAYRFQYIGGDPLYADLDGSNNGYSSAQAGHLVAAGDTLFCDRFE
jgi:hypothetical protein